MFLFVPPIFLAVAGGTACAQEFDHSPWDRVLKKYVTETGRVDYPALINAPVATGKFETKEENP